VLLWLAADRDTWRAAEFAEWTRLTATHRDSGSPRYVAAILGAEDIAVARARDAVPVAATAAA
jgi:hypothetical protein